MYATNGPDANIFGLEPNYGCCTANMHQGWPKFASSLWMKTPDNGLAAVAYGPCVVNTKIEGKPVRIEVQTDYPFSDTVKIFVEAEGRMPLRCESRRGLRAPMPWSNKRRRLRLNPGSS